MKSVRLIAHLLFHLTRITSILYLLVAAYATVAFLLSLNGPPAWAPIQLTPDGGFRISYPFTRTVFLLGDYHPAYMITTLSAILLYGIFLWLLSGVFNAFRQEKLFTPKGVARLSRFYIANLTVPVGCLILMILFGLDIQDVLALTMLHLVIGVFAFFMAAIFKQGLVLQEEQDLTL